MGSLSGVGIALCIVFGCILIAFVAAELYYFLWWKRRHTTPNPNTRPRTFAPFLFFKRKTSQELMAGPIRNSLDEEMGNYGNTLGLNLIKTRCDSEEPVGVETELMRAHNLAGPPRFLFTIKEETREEMDSDEGKSRRLSDVIFAVDGTPFLTPLSSPKLRAPRTTESFRINPLFEEEEEYYLERLRSSPPPKLKFLKDAEDKFLRRFLEEKKGGQEFLGVNKSEEDRPWNCCGNNNGNGNGNVRSGSFVSLISKGQGGSAQVLPLSSSPTSLQSSA